MTNFDTLHFQLVRLAKELSLEVRPLSDGTTLVSDREPGQWYGVSLEDVCACGEERCEHVALVIHKRMHNDPDYADAWTRDTRQVSLNYSHNKVDEADRRFIERCAAEYQRRQRIAYEQNI